MTKSQWNGCCFVLTKRQRLAGAGFCCIFGQMRGYLLLGSPTRPSPQHQQLRKIFKDRLASPAIFYKGCCWTIFAIDKTASERKHYSYFYFLRRLPVPRTQPIADNNGQTNTSNVVPSLSISGFSVPASKEYTFDSNGHQYDRSLTYDSNGILFLTKLTNNTITEFISIERYRDTNIVQDFNSLYDCSGVRYQLHRSYKRNGKLFRSTFYNSKTNKEPRVDY